MRLMTYKTENIKENKFTFDTWANIEEEEIPKAIHYLLYLILEKNLKEVKYKPNLEFNVEH